MSLDNILGVAAAANGNSVLLIIGLITSMPIVIYGSFITLKLMRRFHYLPTLGAAFLGYIACEMGMNDIVIADSFGIYSNSIHLIAPIIAPIMSGIMVVVVARVLILIQKRRQASISSIDPTFQTTGLKNSKIKRY
jgi:predicted tellurium resistance membrane protein TerC